MAPDGWQQRVDDLWASFDDHDEEAFLARMEALASELPDDSPEAAFERASAFDSTGHSDRAVPLYRRALELGLDGPNRRRAVIQMASSLRNLGQASESVELLSAERERGSDELDDAVSAFLALALVDTGREREAVALALAALAPHLPRYQRSVGNYARELRGSARPGH
jgi:tetratricopeptide (TPR) repeat protein